MIEVRRTGRDNGLAIVRRIDPRLERSRGVRGWHADRGQVIKGTARRCEGGVGLIQDGGLKLVRHGMADSGKK